MSNKNIKGLTVEIGGNTTKLGKALDDVTKKGRDVSSELGQINKLLKLDPGNTELLAQKQKVLADALENSADKLKTLKEAEKQVQAQFKRGEVSEEQVRQLQREIIQTEKKMESYQKAAKETADQIKQVGKDTEDTAEKTHNFGEAAKAAGGVAVKGFAAVTGILAAAAGALAAAAEESREYRTETGKLETAFTTSGHSAEVATTTYKSLQGVLGETDQAVEAANHLAKLTKSEQDLEKWTNICTGVYATFGASLPVEGLAEAANETAKVGKVTGPLADALNWAGVSEDAFNESLAACSDEQERQTLIMETLNGLYDDAATKYKETNAEVIRANEANEEWASVMAEVGGAVEPVLSDVKLLGASLLSDLVPGIKEVTGSFHELLNGEEGAGAELGEAVGDLLGDVISKAAELIPTIVQVGISLVVSLAESIVAELPGLVSSITQVLIDSTPVLLEGATSLLMAVISAIDLILPPLIEAIPLIIVTLVDGLVSAIPDLIQGAVLLLNAIISAIPLFLKSLLPQVPRIVDSIISGLLGALPLLVDGAVQLLMGILDAYPEVQAAIIESAPSIVKSICDGLLSAIPELIKAGCQLLGGLVKGLLDFDISKAVGKVGDSVVKGFKKAFDIHSPSRRTKNEVGKPAIEGVAEGIEENADAPINAMADVTDEMIAGAESLNGLTLERRLVNTFGPADTGAPVAGLSAKLDQILAAIKRGQVIMLDGKTLVGSTADRYDTELGQRRVLTERGAL